MGGLLRWLIILNKKLSKKMFVKQIFQEALWKTITQKGQVRGLSFSACCASSQHMRLSENVLDK